MGLSRIGMSELVVRSLLNIKNRLGLAAGIDEFAGTLECLLNKVENGVGNIGYLVYLV